MTSARHSSGRPLRALQLLGLALLLGFAARLPTLLAETRAIIAANAPMPPHTPNNRQAPPLLALATTTPATLPPYRAPSANTAMVALLPKPEILIPTGIRPVAAPPPHPIDTPHVTIAATPPQPMMPPPPAPAGFALAEAAYARLAAGDRRSAAALFDQALATSTAADPNTAAWASQRALLTKHWSGDAYVLVRDGGSAGPTASPVLGGGQVGAGLAFTPDPLARRPFAAIARLNAATDNVTGPDSLQAAIGIRWKPVPAVTIAAERLVAIGKNAIDDWSLRIAAGADGHHGRTDWSGYAEADVLGNGDIFAGGQARAGLGLTLAKTRLAIGGGTWASVQTGAGSSHRVDIGPSLVAHAPIGRINLEIAADWRFRVIGNAAPNSGPALTVATSF